MDPIRCEILKKNDARQLVHMVARTFSADQAVAFVNGVLDAVHRGLAAPAGEQGAGAAGSASS